MTGAIAVVELAMVGAVVGSAAVVDGLTAVVLGGGGGGGVVLGATELVTGIVVTTDSVVVTNVDGFKVDMEVMLLDDVKKVASWDTKDEIVLEEIFQVFFSLFFHFSALQFPFFNYETFR